MNPSAGKLADPTTLVDVPKLIADYYTEIPDPSVREQRVSFGTSGHRGSSLRRQFNEWHILAVTQAICEVRAQQGIDGPLFLGIDTHALSEPAFRSALEVLAANGVQAMIAEKGEFTPTPALSHAILTYNRGRTKGRADGIVVTPSHNPPEDGGFKYNPPHGGPADSAITRVIETRANQLLEAGLEGVRRVPFERARRASTTSTHDYLNAYVSDLGSVIKMDAVRDGKLALGVDPLGGAGVHYWSAIADRFKLHLTIANPSVDPTFRFMSLDWDGQIRMDPSSPHAMASLIALKDGFDVAFACDTDHDRHGIVTKSSGLLPSNHYLAVCVHYLFTKRPNWGPQAAVGKTVVSSSMIDRVAEQLGRKLYEVPVGFKWFVEGLVDGWLGFVGEESAGASFLRQNGSVWTTDKDGMIAALLAAEMTAVTGHDPAELYGTLTHEFGNYAYERIDAPATVEQKSILGRLSSQDIQAKELAGDAIRQILTKAPGDGSAIGGMKVITDGGWFAARPSGTENIYKLYAESFRGAAHLKRIQEEAQEIVSRVLEKASVAVEKP